MLIIMILMVLLLISGAAILSASETSVTAVSRAKLFQMFKNGNKKAGLTRELTENLGLSLSAILLCNTLIITFTTSQSPYTF